MTPGAHRSMRLPLATTSQEDAPVFIAGLAHSGKTELRRALSCLPHLELTRRTYVWTRFYDRFGDLGDDANLSRCLGVLAEDEDAARLEPDIERIEREFLSGPRTYTRLFAIFHRQHAERRGKTRWGDQLGSVEHLARRILTALPEARMIHMIRDPRSLFAPRGGSTSSAERIGLNTARWVASASAGQTNMQTFPERYLILRHEDLWSRTPDVLQQVCQFLEEPYSPDMVVKLSGNRRGGDDEESMIRRPAFEIVFTELHAAEHLAALRYPVSGIQMSRSERLAYRLSQQPRGRAAMKLWRATQTRRYR